MQFLGVDSVEDLRNQSCQELFVDGGQVLSDEMVLNPDCISHGTDTDTPSQSLILFLTRAAEVKQTWGVVAFYIELSVSNNVLECLNLKVKQIVHHKVPEANC